MTSVMYMTKLVASLQSQRGKMPQVTQLHTRFPEHMCTQDTTRRATP